MSTTTTGAATKTAPTLANERAQQAFDPAAAAPTDFLADGEPEFVAAVFVTPESAQSAVQRLFRAGFHVEQISVVAPATEVVEDGPGVSDESPVRGERKWAASGALFGAVSGSAVATGFVATAGLGMLAVAGPLVLGIASGAIFGTLVGAMARRGVDPDAAEHYLRAACDGCTLVAVDAKGRGQVEQARVAFAESGASGRAERPHPVHETRTSTGADR